MITREDIDKLSLGRLVNIYPQLWLEPALELSAFEHATYRLMATDKMDWARLTDVLLWKCETNKEGAWVDVLGQYTEDEVLGALDSARKRAQMLEMG